MTGGILVLMRGTWLTSPRRDFVLIGAVGVALLLNVFVESISVELLMLAGIGSIPLALRAARDIAHTHISLDVFNLFAIGVSLATGEVVSAAFIILMITSADILQLHTSRRTQHAVEHLLKLKPQTALRQRGNTLETIAIGAVRVGDTLIVESGQAIPVDGVVISGRALVNEALVTGESVPVEKIAGASVLVSTVVDTGAIKVRAARVGKDSTIERMAELMRSAAANKSKPERIADRFAGIFLPIVILFGAGVYIVTRDLRMTAALFLVACADDMAVAIPLAMTASLGWAAKRGVVIKGGAWLHTLSKVRTLVLDKTGTLTYGTFRLDRLEIEPGIEEKEFWRMVGVAEKYSEHPIGRALSAQARDRVGEIPDPDDITVHKGAGIAAQMGGHRVAVGDEKLLQLLHIPMTERMRNTLSAARAASVGTSVLVLRDGILLGSISLADAPRPEASRSLQTVRELGIRDIVMFTGDNERTANRVASQLGITRVRAQMKPEQKLIELKSLQPRPVAMVGDGINDAPALARADVGIAMGKGGTAIASEAADVIILTDDLSRLADLVVLGRRTMSVINWDIVIWGLSNVVGFTLVLTGIAGPALAAFYNFSTDFLPLINSSRLFRSKA
ncbi:MAG: heavy metal translocating P-type ATPase [Patescibacteria group bacterium]